ncbi:MAG TPA: DegV family protein [Herpetosiphonaceae bacterium]
MTVIVTDSTSDIPPALAKALDIHIIPLQVNFGSESFADGVELTSEQFYGKLEASQALPTTSQPSVGAFEELYRKVGGKDQPIVSVHISSKLSGTIRSAQQAVELLPDQEIHVVDAEHTTMALGWIAILAARAAKAGKGADEIAAMVAGLPKRTFLYAALDTLRYLEKGGRIGKTRALLGTMLNVKPIIHVSNGEVMPFEQVRTKKKAHARLLDVAREIGPFEELCVLHGRAEEDAKAFAQQLSDVHPAEKIVIAEIGSVVGVHVGPGCIGITGIRKSS